MSNILGNAIKQYRINHSNNGEPMSQRQFGKLVDLSYTYIDKLEKGESSPTLEAIYKLNRILNKNFIIVPNEPIKMISAFEEIKLLNSKYEKEFIEFLEDPENELLLRLAKVIKDTNSIDNFAVKTIFEEYKKKS